MKREIRNERNKLRERSILLRDVLKDDKTNKNKTNQIYEEQNKIYQKYKFYDNFIKAQEKIKEDK